MANPDFRMYPHVYNVLALKGQHFPAYFEVLLNPYDSEEAVKKSEAEFSKIDIPTYTGSGWYGYTYKTHLLGAQNWYRNIDPPAKKLLLLGPAHLDRPFKAFHAEILRWYDHWLKGIDTGILRDPPVRFWVMGANEWRSGSDWPLPETQWVKFYLNGWERLTTDPFVPASADDYQAPDAFAQMPASQTNRVQKLRYLSEPLAHDLTIAGPSVLNLFASIDQDDTNWIVILKDVGPDVGVQTAREGERDVTPRAARARTDARLAQGQSSRCRSYPLTARPAVASAHARRAEEGGARRDQRIRHRDRGDRQLLQGRSPHLRRDHQPRRRDRRRRRQQRRVHPLPHLQQQDRAASHLS